jgi:hypothetical protein
VYLNGEPLEGAEVNFLTDEFASTAISNSKGEYELAQGAVPGKNKVYITMWKGDGIDPNSEEALETAMDPGQAEAMLGADPDSKPVEVAGALEQTLPAKYSDPEKSVLSFPVPEGGTSKANFKLSTE